MNRLFLLTLALSFFFKSTGQIPPVNQLTSSQFHELVHKNKGTLLDVRTESEFANGHIPSAGQLNYYALDFRQKLLLLPKDQPVYLYCNTGYRSHKAAEILAEEGYTKVYNLQQGIMEWDLQNLPVVVEADARPDTENKMEPDEFYALIKSDIPVFVDFYAPWCGPCRQMMPMIENLKSEYSGRVKVIKINADASKKLVKELHISGVPYLVLYKNGVASYTHNGLISKSDLTNVLESGLLKAQK